MKASTIVMALIGALALAVPASGQTGPLYLDGYIGAEHARIAGLSANFGLVDLRVGTDPAQADGIGFEFGLYAHGQDLFAVTNDATAFATLSFRVGGGRLQVGAPRSAAWSYDRTPLPAGVNATLATNLLLTGEVPLSTNVALGTDRPFLGLRYDSRQDGRHLALSAATIDTPGGQATALAIGGQQRLGGWDLHGGLEVLFGAGDGTSLNLGARRIVARDTAGPFAEVEVGGLLSHLDTPGLTATTARVYATGRFSGGLSVTGVVMHMRSATSETIVGINTQYAFRNGVAVNAGVARGNAAFGTLWSIGLGRTF